MRQLLFLLLVIPIILGMFICMVIGLFCATILSLCEGYYDLTDSFKDWCFEGQE